MNIYHIHFEYNNLYHHPFFFEGVPNKYAQTLTRNIKADNKKTYVKCLLVIFQNLCCCLRYYRNLLLCVSHVENHEQQAPMPRGFRSVRSSAPAACRSPHITASGRASHIDFHRCGRRPSVTQPQSAISGSSSASASPWPSPAPSPFSRPPTGPSGP